MKEEENIVEQVTHGEEAHENNPEASPSDPNQEVAVTMEAEVSEELTDDYISSIELNEVIESLCLSKVEEFKLIGYEHVSGKEIWDCVSDKYQKKGIPPLHQIVNDILSLKSTQFMNWMTMSAYKGAQF
ncbi:Post-transcriptional regulator ComN [compost metagenome]